MGRAYLLVEGHGEVEAAGNLIVRLSQDLHLPQRWAQPMRTRNLHQKAGMQRGANLVRNLTDAEALLVLRDEDDACPKERAPTMASWLRELALPFPTALVLLHPEYEVLFLPCLARMAGQLLGSGASARPGLRPDTAWTGDWEKRRGVKEWLSAHFPRNRSYKPTLDQLPMTRMLDLLQLRAANVPCFGTLERALVFLAQNNGIPGAVYPP